jgi:hypothetical protein
VVVIGTELVVGGRLVLARPGIEFVPPYRSRAPATLQIALDNPPPKLIDLGGEIV